MAYNVRRVNWKARDEIVKAVRRRALSGEPCGICGLPFDPDKPEWIVNASGKRVRAPWAIDCDEILPVSRGGSPIDPANVQPAHHACNMHKGARICTDTHSARAVGSVSRSW